MLTIRIEVPVERECVAEAELLAGRSRLASGAAVASASATLARRHGNPACSPLRAWGHPPAGSYELLDLGMTLGGGRGRVRQYPARVPAHLGAGARRRILWAPVAAGVRGAVPRSGYLPLTKGGIRLEQGLFDRVVHALERDSEARLEINDAGQPAWWQFWRKPVVTNPQPTKEPGCVEPPFDEISIANAIAGGKRLDRRPAPDRDDDDDDWRDRRSSGSSDSGGFGGGGGQYGGAGASGRWGSPGVDANGRILTTAGGAVLMGAGSDTSADGSAAESEDSADSTATQTGTSY